MADFMSNLWTSVFVPGPTSTLLVATNVAFGSLQIVFLALLFLTYSVHFIVLSFLCGGLWWGINWFAGEIRLVQAEAEEKARREGRDVVGSDVSDVDADVDVDVDESGADTEMEESVHETPREQRLRQPLSGAVSAGAVEGRQEKTPLIADLTSPAIAAPSGSGGVWSTSTAARLAPPGADAAVRRRRDMADSTELSTDSEWEKVEGEQ